ncbi:hypothetical protein MRX96_058005 [Rhipicephalus microplus]
MIGGVHPCCRFSLYPGFPPVIAPEHVTRYERARVMVKKLMLSADGPPPSLLPTEPKPSQSRTGPLLVLGHRLGSARGVVHA